MKKHIFVVFSVIVIAIAIAIAIASYFYNNSSKSERVSEKISLSEFLLTDDSFKNLLDSLIIQ